MAAEIKPRAEVDERTDLKEVLPLSTPFTIFIDPSDVCNFQCTFCPTGDRKLMKNIQRTPTKMDFELFKKIVDDISKFNNPIKLLRLHKDGEPLLNPNFSKMIQYAKKSPNILKVDTTTNASLLTKSKSLEIIAAGLDRINISIEGMNKKHYLNIAKYKINFDELVDNISFFYKNKQQCEVSIKIPGDWLTEADKKDFIDIFSPIADRIFIENISNCWPDFMMKDITINEKLGVYGEKKVDLNVCPYIFYSIVVNANGTVSACCVDWQRKLLIGDTKVESLTDIWKSEKLRNLQILHLEGKRNKHPICKSCHLAESCSGDNLDKNTSMLLKRMKND